MQPVAPPAHTQSGLFWQVGWSGVNSQPTKRPIKLGGKKVKAAALGEQKPALGPPTQVHKPVELQGLVALKLPQVISALLTWHNGVCIPEPEQFKICS